MLSSSTTASHYWAHWDPITFPPEVIRRDTRIFWEPQTCGTCGQCVGTFHGENPGGAASVHGLKFHGYSPVEHRGTAGDPTLRFLLDVWRLAVAGGLAQPRSTDFIEVLNTYYFRNPASGESLGAWRSCGGSAIYCPSPSASSRFVLLGWGIGHTTSPEAVLSASTLALCARVIVPSSTGVVSVVHGNTLFTGVSSGPATPSYVLMRSKRIKPVYMTNVSRELR